MTEEYVWASYANAETGLIDEPSLWAEGESVDLVEVVADLTQRVAELADRVEDLEAPAKGKKK